MGRGDCGAALAMTNLQAPSPIAPRGCERGPEEQWRQFAVVKFLPSQCSEFRTVPTVGVVNALNT